MNNWFTLYLDTTPPEIEIIVPNYVSKTTETEIIIQANETLSQYQEIYLIDSEGNRFDFIFEYDINRYIGSLNLNECTLGSATLYARLRDEVFNTSSLIFKTINIIESNILQMAISEFIQEITVSESIQEITLIEFN